jgi:hypothetical protein
MCAPAAHTRHVPMVALELPKPLLPCALTAVCCPCPLLQEQPEQVDAHFENQPYPFPMVSARRHSFECVDARGQNPMLGTPGGDLAEAMAAAMTIIKLK